MNRSLMALLPWVSGSSMMEGRRALIRPSINRKVIGSSPVGRTRIFPSMPVSGWGFLPRFPANRKPRDPNLAVPFDV